MISNITAKLCRRSSFIRVRSATRFSLLISRAGGSLRERKTSLARRYPRATLPGENGEGTDVPFRYRDREIAYVARARDTFPTTTQFGIDVPDKSFAIIS